MYSPLNKFKQAAEEPGYAQWKLGVLNVQPHALSLLKKLGIRAQGLQAQLVSLSQEKKKPASNMQIYLMPNTETV